MNTNTFKLILSSKEANPKLILIFHVFRFYFTCYMDCILVLRLVGSWSQYEQTAICQVCREPARLQKRGH